MSTILNYDDIPEHDNADQWQDELPAPGSVLQGEKEGETFTVKRAKVISAFWVTQNIICTDAEPAPELTIGQHSNCATVLYLIEPEPKVEPLRVRLTEDYLDFATGIGYPEGTVLVRSPRGTGQYMPEGTPLGAGGCVAYLGLLEGNYEPIE